MKEVLLSDVVEINPRYQGNGDPSTLVSFVPMASVGEDGSLNVREMRPLSDVKKGFTYFENGDVLIAKITPCFENGKATMVNNLANTIGFGSTEFHVLRPSKQIDQKYLFYAVWNQSFREIGADRMTGSAGQKRVPTDFLRNYRIPLPDLSEQRRIATILDKADAIRRKRRQAIDLMNDFLRSVFLEMFGDPDAPTNSYSKVSLDECADLLPGFAFKSNEFSTDTSDYKLCRGINVGVGKVDWSDSAYWSRAASLKYEKYLLEVDDIVIAMDRPWISTGFKIAQIQQKDLPSLLVQRVMRLRAKPPFTNAFLYQLLRLPSFTRHCKPTETTIPHISPTDIRTYQVIKPDPKKVEEFTSIANRTSKIDSFELSQQLVENLFSSVSSQFLTPRSKEANI